MKRIIYLSMTALMMSCSGFLDRAPSDALSPSTFWKTEADANMAATGCYSDWYTGSTILYLDCTSDIGYNNFPWEGYTKIGNGSFSASDSGAGFYDYTTIRRCNEFLSRIDGIPFKNEADKKDLISQVRFIRSFRYFLMVWNYGGVQIVENYTTSEESQVARNSEKEVKDYIQGELVDLVAPGVLNETPKERGRIARGAALALKMRIHLYYGEYQDAIDAANEIETLGYSLEPEYANLFRVTGQGSKEIILASQYILETSFLSTVGQMYPNVDGGWSSMVPTQALVDMYETSAGLTIAEATTAGSYDVEMPYVDRDPRLYKTVLLPGFDWMGTNGKTRVFNTLDKSVTVEGESVTNADYLTGASNAPQTGISWRKYTDPATQYNDIWKTNACPIIFRYGEVLLTIAEAKIELGIIDDEMYSAIDMIRTRAGMPVVDRAKYNNQATLRELIRRERGVEFAGEGIRRPDILRWKDASGNMLAMTLLNMPVERVPIGLGESEEKTTGSINYSDTNQETRALFVVNDLLNAKRTVENRKFKTYNRYYPFAQAQIDNNPKMVQNTGY